MRKALVIGFVLLALVLGGSVARRSIARHDEDAPKPEALSLKPGRTAARSGASRSAELKLSEAAVHGPQSGIRNPQSGSSPRDEALPAELAGYGRRNGRAVTFETLAWAAGDTWRVETHYLQMQHEGRSAWSKEPIVWRYAVRGIEKLDGRDVYAIEVEPEDLTNLPYNPGGTVYVAAGDHAVLAVRDRALEAGRIRERFVRFEDGRAFSALFPTELPPLDAPATERAGTLGALARDPFRRDPQVEPPVASGRVVDVAFESNGEIVRQRWDVATRLWPLVSRTASRVSYLRAGS